MDELEIKRTILKSELLNIDTKNTIKKMGNLGHRKVVEGIDNSEKINNISGKYLGKQNS